MNVPTEEELRIFATQGPAFAVKHYRERTKANLRPAMEAFPVCVCGSRHFSWWHGCKRWTLPESPP